MTTPAPSFPPRGVVDGDQLPFANCCAGIELKAGDYASPDFIPLAMSVEVGDGWKGYQNSTDGVFAFLKGTNLIDHATQWLVLTAVHPETAREFVDELRTTPRLTAGAEQAVEVAGFPGQRIDSGAEPNPAEQGGPTRIPGTIEIRAMRLITGIPHGWTTESKEAQLRIYVLEAAPGITIVAYIEAPPSAFSAFVSQVDEVLGTLTVATG